MSVSPVCADCVPPSVVLLEPDEVVRVEVVAEELEELVPVVELEPVSVVPVSVLEVSSVPVSEGTSIGVP
ncbi:hypothetical protein GCM10025860_15430 [Methanobacterium ferruginis]|nr:hypothetical protein GCM10025860_15430 [Methanobacterium ferruginis]